MRRLNLAPENLKESLKVKGKDSIIVAAKIFGVFLAICVFASLIQFVSGKRLEALLSRRAGQLEEARGKLEGMQKARDEIRRQRNNIVDKQKNISERIGFLEKMQSERIKYSLILGKISQIIPDNIWLDAFQIDQNRVVLEGSTNRDRLVSEFMSRLDKSGYFENTVFSFIKSKNEKDKKFMTYRIITYIERKGYD